MVVCSPPVEDEFGPFGEVLRATGPMAQSMPLRFSTMYADDVTGDVKYLYRDLRTHEGRWTSRDPIEETGGLNLYSFLSNEGSASLDFLGLLVIREGDELTITRSNGEVIGTAKIREYRFHSRPSRYGANLKIDLDVNCECGKKYRWAQRITFTDEHGNFYTDSQGRLADSVPDPGPGHWYNPNEYFPYGTCFDGFEDNPRRVWDWDFPKKPELPIERVKFTGVFYLTLEEVNSMQDEKGEPVLIIEWGFWGNALHRGGLLQ